MKDDLSNLKEITDLVLKDIYVTDDLRTKTLEMCKKEKNRVLKPFLAATISAATITLSLMGYQYFSSRIDTNPINTKQVANNVNNNSDIAMENIEKDLNSDLNAVENQNLGKDSAHNYTDNKNKVNLDTIADTSKYKNSAQNRISNNDSVSNKDANTNTNINTSTNINTNTNTNTNTSTVSPDNNNPIASEDKTLQKTLETVPNNSISDVTTTLDNHSTKESKSISDSTPVNSPMVAPTGTLSTAEAEKYWGSTLILPSYIPVGFELTDICIPKDDKEKYIKLTYSLNNTYFKITQNKSTKYNITGKSISISNINATIAEDKNDTTNNIIITQIVFEKDNIQYLIVGNISEAELTNIAKSLI